MKRKMASAMTLVLLLTSMLTLAFHIQPVGATGTVYIRADGSIDPPTAPIQRNGDIYTLTGNVVSDSDGIVVERDNIVVDGAGYAVEGGGKENGTLLIQRSNVTIRNLTIKSFDYGIVLLDSSDNILSSNTVTNNSCDHYVDIYGSGIYLSNSSRNVVSGNTIRDNCRNLNYGSAIWLNCSSQNTLIGNTISNNTYGGIYLLDSSGNAFSGNSMVNQSLFGVRIDRSCNNTFSGNTFLGCGLSDIWDSYGNVMIGNSVNGKPLVFLENAADNVVSNAGQVVLVRCRNITVCGLNLSNTSTGVLLWATNNTNITNNCITNDPHGIKLLYSFGTIMSGNSVANSGHSGITLAQSPSTTISGNNITDNLSCGIEGNSNDSIISGNNITGNDLFGVGLVVCSGVQIYGNNIANNKVAAFGVYSCSGNTIYHNNVVNNSKDYEGMMSNSTGAWDNGYPSGGNYWSNYSGNDLCWGANQDLAGSDGICDAPYVVDSDNRDHYPLTQPWSPPDLAITGISCSCYGQMTAHSGIVSINVDLRNSGNKSELAEVKIYANNSLIKAGSLVLPPQSTRRSNYTWNVAGYRGQYRMSALVESLQGECDTNNNGYVDGYMNVSGKGYFILVAGNCYGNLLSAINDGCNRVYKTLRSIGYSPNDICYLNQQSLGNQDVDRDGTNDIDCWSSSTNLRWAIETWALGKASPTEPVFIYLFDHGAPDRFAINEPDEVTSMQLRSWLDNLQQATGASIHVIYAACHSGSFINDLSKSGRVTVTSCSPDEFSKVGPGGTWEAFSMPFWNQIKSGHSVLSSFNYAYSAVAPKYFWEYWWPWRKIWPPQNPLLDDNGDGIGHGGSLPNGGDGNLANNLYIGSCEWPYPWISQVTPRLYPSWPPSDVTLWVTIENKTSLSSVKAFMLPPDWSEPNSTDTLLDLNLESFEMTDEDGDGNWTVNIPAESFTNHSSFLGNFTFFITAEEENGDLATPSFATVQFTETGETPQDLVRPIVHIERPLEESIIGGLFQVNGTAIDDVCLDRVEVYVDNVLQGTSSMPPASTSYFEFNIDTSTLQNGNTTVLVKAYDKSGNCDNESVIVFVQNSVRDVSVSKVSISKTIIGQGSTAQIEVTMANHGSHPEILNITIYANENPIATQLISLCSQNHTALVFLWNTSTFAKGNYTINAYAQPVPEENNMADNTLVGETVRIGILGDVDPVDGYVGIDDIFAIASRFGQEPNHPSWNANYDINDDSYVGIDDIFTAASHFGQEENP